MRASLYIRLDFDKHGRLAAYAKEYGLTMNDAVERLVDQLLLQTSPGFRAPPWLVEAIAAGHLPFELPEQVVDDTPGDDEQEEPAPVVSKLLRAL